MATREAFKIVSRRGNGLWSWWVKGKAAVRYSSKYWAKPKCVWRTWMAWKGKRLSVFCSLDTAKVSSRAVRLIQPNQVEIWRCMYCGKPQKEQLPSGTLRVTSVKLVKGGKVWPEDGSE